MIWYGGASREMLQQCINIRWRKFVSLRSIVQRNSTKLVAFARFFRLFCKHLVHQQCSERLILWRVAIVGFVEVSSIAMIPHVI